MTKGSSFLLLHPRDTGHDSNREGDPRVGWPQTAVLQTRWRGDRMKARCKRKELLAAFGMVSGVVPTRSPKPILQNVKLVVDPEVGTILMATDLEVGIRHKVYGVTAYEPGSVILPTTKMQSILSTSADAELDIETEGDHLIVRWSVRSVPPAERRRQPLPRGARLRRHQLPRRRGGRPAEADPPDHVRHRRREHPVRPGRRPDRADQRHHHHGRDRWPPPGQDVRAGGGRERRAEPGGQPGHPGQGAQADRPEPGRSRAVRPHRHPRRGRRS